MISLGNRRLWLYGGTVDMRKGITGLANVVQHELGREVMTGEVFLAGRTRLRAHLDIDNAIVETARTDGQVGYDHGCPIRFTAPPACPPSAW